MKALAIAVTLSLAGLTSCVALTEPPDDPGFLRAAATVRDNPPVANLIAIGPAQTTLSASERELYGRLMEHRKAHGLPPIPISKSLSFVAKLHVFDLERNGPVNSTNYHSWSPQGPWRAVHYTPDHRHARLMWGKPRELTRYRGNGYEIVHMNSEAATHQGAFAAWKASVPHNEVILNQRAWKRLDWEAIGLGIYGRYAAVWFGTERDAE